MYSSSNGEPFGATQNFQPSNSSVLFLHFDWAMLDILGRLPGTSPCFTQFYPESVVGFT